jgi:drug/metabolite transporter (DMT)-like permease
VRYGLQALLMGLWLGANHLRGRGAGFRSAHPRFQALRGVLLLATSAFGFLALQRMPVAEFTAIVMLTPVLVTLLAAWLLHERVTALRWALVAGAFAGTLLVVRPGGALFGWAALLPLASSACYAVFQLLTRKLAALEHPLTTHFYTGLVGTALIAPPALLGPVDVAGALLGATAPTWAALAVVGICGTLGHLLLIVALGQAPASTLMPFMYLQIAMATTLGWLVFGDLPDAWGWLGMAVIALCGATSAWLNLRAAGPQAGVSAAAVAPEED